VNGFHIPSGQEWPRLCVHRSELFAQADLADVIVKALEIEEAERDTMDRVKEAGTLEAFFDSY
jgi:hypothetical protein